MRKQSIAKSKKDISYFYKMPFSLFSYPLYPFTDPRIIPEIKNFRKISAVTAGGITARIPAAAVSPY